MEALRVANRLRAACHGAADAQGWLFCARGLYKAREYSHAVQALALAVRSEECARDGYHLLAFSLYHLKQYHAAAQAFHTSVSLGTDSDWQLLVELAVDDPALAATFKAQHGHGRRSEA